ncbi:hypothetical protein HDU76_010823 [Blyttiomyces sp. JEL0837]|nr:hypothetical protein HDU76_010823 [Blyttiomyces sp. JEL0837]
MTVESIRRPSRQQISIYYSTSSNPKPTPPWNQLSKEIHSLYAHTRHTSHESSLLRQYILNLENSICEILGPETLLKQHGSVAAGLGFPNSDIDLLICNNNLFETPSVSKSSAKPSSSVFSMISPSGESMDGNASSSNKLKFNDQITESFRKREATVVILEKVQRHLQSSSRLQIASSRLISSSIPHLEIADAKTRWTFDISMAQQDPTSKHHPKDDHALHRLYILQNLISQNPNLPALVIIIKLLLRSRGLDSASVGGIGGYSVAVWIAAFLHLSLRDPNLTSDVSFQLFHFVNAFSLESGFDPLKHYIRWDCISSSTLPSFKPYISEIPFTSMRRKKGEHGISIEDPAVPLYNVTGQCTRFGDVRRAFSEFRDALVGLGVVKTGESGVVTALDEFSIVRRVLGRRVLDEIVQLKLAINRLQLLQAKKAAYNQQCRREIAQLLEKKKIESARVRVEHIIREDFSIEAMEILELYLDMLVARFGLLEQLKNCDQSISEAVNTLIYAAPRFAVQELTLVQNQLKAKFGKEFAAAALENSNDVIVHKLNAHSADPVLVDQYLKAIAKAYDMPWDNSNNYNPGNGGGYPGSGGYNGGYGGGTGVFNGPIPSQQPNQSGYYLSPPQQMPNTNPSMAVYPHYVPPAADMMQINPQQQQQQQQTYPQQQQQQSYPVPMSMPMQTPIDLQLPGTQFLQTGSREIPNLDRGLGAGGGQGQTVKEDDDLFKRMYCSSSRFYFTVEFV